MTSLLIESTLLLGKTVKFSDQFGVERTAKVIGADPRPLLHRDGDYVILVPTGGGLSFHLPAKDVTPVSV